MRYLLLVFIGVIVILAMQSCAPARPAHVDNACKMFKQYPAWYRATERAYKHWQVPLYVQLAVIRQESNFNAAVKPPRPYIFGIIPWFRSSSAYGYSQAKSATWREYRKASGNRYASRSQFDDSVDFIAWYLRQAQRKLKIPITDTYGLYLAYHEGLGGYRRQTYLRKPWLVKVAKRVAAHAQRYRQQLQQCRKQFAMAGWF